MPPVEDTGQKDLVTASLRELAGGDAAAADRLFPLVYEPMRRLARRYFAKEDPGHTLQPTALVHEAYLRLVDAPGEGWTGRAHFYAIASRVMRRILIDHAKACRAVKRGGGSPVLSLADSEPASADALEVDLPALDEALARLEVLDQRQCRIVEMRFFGGLSVEETAEALGVSPRTVELDWKMARAWLFSQLSK